MSSVALRTSVGALIAAWVAVLFGATAAAQPDGPPAAPRFDPERPWVLGAGAAEAVARRLGIAAAADPFADDLVVESVAVGPTDLTFALRDGRGGPPVVLRATHAGNAPSVQPAETLYEDGDLYVYAEPAHAARLRAAARDVGPRLGGLPWERQERGAAPRPTDRAALALSLVLWALLGVAGTSLALELRGGGRAEGGLGVPALPLAALAVAAFVLRAALGVAGPSSYVDVQRVSASALLEGGNGEFLVLPLLAEVLAPWRVDPLATVADVNLVLGALTPPLVVLLGVLWGGDRRTGQRLGWVAGLALAVSPLSIRFAHTGTETIAAGFLLVAAALATEVWARRRTPRAALAAGLLWAIAFQVRPELPAWVALPLLWVGLDGRLRGALRRAAGAVAFLGPVVLSLGCDVWLSLQDRPHHAVPALLPTDPLYWQALPHGLWQWYLAPADYPPVFTATLLVGALLARGRTRWLLLLAGLVLPVGLALLSGLPLAYPELAASNQRYVVHGHAFAALLSAWGVARVWPRRGRDLVAFLRRLAVAAALIAFALAPAAYRDRIGTPSPLQHEHAFLARHGARLAPCALVTVLGAADPQMVVAEQVDSRLSVAAARVWDGAPPQDVEVRTVPLDDLDGDLPRPDCERYYLRAWTEFVEPGMELPPEDLADFRRRLAARWRLEPLVCELARTIPSPGHEDGTMPLCLFRLHPRADRPAP